ncbi:MAG TPA: SDR family NAD(P)-dependent oxidoreductase [Acidimicrobiales bacterium]|nr:SDR family NAD(P)-dependent oxidoreductase [Acidimicrobiales bacterium]
MSAIVWISGASGGIGKALVQTVPFDDARLIGISRSEPPAPAEHLDVDLADPSSWETVAESFRTELEGFDGAAAIFFQVHGVADPLGYAAEVDTEEYARNVLVNCASPQVHGQAFLAAAKDLDAHRHLVIMTSGAADSVYPGWASYGAAKAAVDQWVRNVGAEQQERGGVHVMAIGPGTVDTGMQAKLRETSEEQFPKRQKFVDAKEEGKLTDPEEVARRLWDLLHAGLDNGTVADLRKLDEANDG